MAKLRYRVVASCRGECAVCGGKGDAVYVCKSAPDRWRRYLCNECLINIIEEYCREKKDVQVGNGTITNSGPNNEPDVPDTSVAANNDTDGELLQELLANTDGEEAGLVNADGADPAPDSGDPKPAKRGKGRGKRK